MAAAWWDRWRRRPVNPFARSFDGDLDLVMAPRYDTTDAVRTEWTAEVDAYLALLLPNAVDAYSREVLDDWIAARLEQALDRLRSEREERQAVGEALVGLARRQVVRCRTRFDADVHRLRDALEGLEVAREALTDRRQVGPFGPPPDLPGTGPTASTLGDVDLATGAAPTPLTGTDGHPSAWRAVPPARPGGHDVVHAEFTPDTTQIDKENGHGN